jgi:hypothetical protein
MPLVVRAFPVTPGQEAAARQFAADLTGSRREEVEALYSRLGIQRECWHLQDTSNGPWVIVVTDLSGEPVAAGEIYAASQAGFERWFKDQVKLVTGIDQDNQPLGPPTEMLLDLTLPQTRASREG